MSEMLPAASAAPCQGPEGPSPNPPPGAPLLRVMCFNVRYGTADDGPNRWEHRSALAVRTVRRFDPDLLGVQEALRFQADALREALPEYGFAGAGRDDGRDRGEICGVFFRLGRFERIDAGNYWLSETPDRPGSRGWDADLPRVATWVKLRDLRHDSGPAGTDPGGHDSGGCEAGTLLFVNTHWDYAGKHARTESARLMRRRMQSVQPAGPVVVVGDFNGTEDDEPYAQLLHGHGDESDRGPRLVDSYRATHPHRLPQEATFHGFTGGRAGSRIDWILHSDDLCTVEADIDPFNEDGRYPSDHFPIPAVLMPKPAPARGPAPGSAPAAARGAP